MSDTERERALLPLLTPTSLFGRIWLILASDIAVGYIALCFGYTIEFAGRDAFIDEFFIQEEARGRGIGSQVLAFVKQAATQLGIAALHLEVARTNEKARHLYAKAGFDSREQFHLMSCTIESDAA
jgi:ribosomal protein S18 acetylase RimI-like enzyme